MKNNKDAELIHRTLDGDETAFTALVEKYQKGVHALVWKKIGDFHIAQEITQDTFLRAYQKLNTLRNRNLFSSWLYVIATRLCHEWGRKKRLPMESLNTNTTTEIEQVAYNQYLAEQRAADAAETRRELVKKLLKKLPESERTVMTLHYLGEMTCEAISEFLGVSPNTVKSRLHRARERLKKEETVIRENLSSFKLPTQLMENIMKKISPLKPTAPSGSKPLVPLVVSAASAILVLLLIGGGVQHLLRFQSPYSFNATSEPTIEIVETQFVIDTPAKPAIRTQVGQSDVSGKGSGTEQRSDVSLFAAARSDEETTSNPKQHWVQTKGPEGGVINRLFSTTRGDIYAGTSTTLYKLADNGNSWKLVRTEATTSMNMLDWVMPMGGKPIVEREDTLYLATDTEVLTSTDNGGTWTSLGTHLKGSPSGIVVTDQAIYLVLMKDMLNSDDTLSEGIFRSEDAGKSWKQLNDGPLVDRKIRAIAAIENTVFAGTDDGLYRLNAEGWKKLSVGEADFKDGKITIPALAVAQNRLYVVAGKKFTNQKVVMTKDSWWSVYRSSDLGESWKNIEPRGEKSKGRFSINFPMTGKNSTHEHIPYMNIKLVAENEKVILIIDVKKIFYSADTGETWKALDIHGSSELNTAFPMLIKDAKTFYRGGQSGIYRTTDGGESWHPFNTGLASAAVLNLIAVNGKLYGSTNDGFVTSTDGGESWEPFRVAAKISGMAEFNDVLYMKRSDKIITLFRLSPDGNELTPILDMPELGEIGKGSRLKLDVFSDKGKKNVKQGTTLDPENVDFDELNEELTQFFQEAAAPARTSLFGSFAVSGDTYYVEYRQKLFRWKSGTTEWYDTGLIDETKPMSPFHPFGPFGYPTDLSSLLEFQIGFKLAVSGKTIYVGNRQGHIFQSFDEGDTWNDVTTNLPFSVKKFYAIDFAGTTVYAATDKGVVYSKTDGTDWHATTDTEGTPLVIKQLTVDDTTVYGVGGQRVYQLKGNSDTWEQMTPEIPSPVASLVVMDNTLYVGTLAHSVLRFTLDE